MTEQCILSAFQATGTLGLLAYASTSGFLRILVSEHCIKAPAFNKSVVSSSVNGTPSCDVEPLVVEGMLTCLVIGFQLSINIHICVIYAWYVIKCTHLKKLLWNFINVCSYPYHNIFSCPHSKSFLPRVISSPSSVTGRHWSFLFLWIGVPPPQLSHNTVSILQCSIFGWARVLPLRDFCSISGVPCLSDVRWELISLPQLWELKCLLPNSPLGIKTAATWEPVLTIRLLFWCPHFTGIIMQSVPPLYVFQFVQ